MFLRQDGTISCKLIDSRSTDHAIVHTREDANHYGHTPLVIAHAWVAIICTQDFYFVNLIFMDHRSIAKIGSLKNFQLYGMEVRVIRSLSACQSQVQLQLSVSVYYTAVAAEHARYVLYRALVTCGFGLQCNMMLT